MTIGKIGVYTNDTTVQSSYCKLHAFTHPFGMWQYMQQSLTVKVHMEGLIDFSVQKVMTIGKIGVYTNDTTVQSSYCKSPAFTQPC